MNSFNLLSGHTTRSAIALTSCYVVPLPAYKDTHPINLLIYTALDFCSHKTLWGFTARLPGPAVVPTLTRQSGEQGAAATKPSL